MPSDTCVIVSYYDERPSTELVGLLRQLQALKAGSDFELRVVVNSNRGLQPQLPADLSSTATDVRENKGFNIGAWDHGWRQNPGYSFYVFLQDECEVVKENWLSRYKDLLSSGDVGLVGESLLFWPNWTRFKNKWPQVHDECVSMGASRNISLGRSPTHAQTLALGASAACLNATDGFLVAQSKAEAIATEIMFSRRCLHRGFEIAQSAWRPFEYFNHPQWSSLRRDSSGLAWNISRALKQLRRA